MISQHIEFFHLFLNRFTFPVPEEYFSVLIENQDMMARIANNMVLTLLYNSSRPLREKMVRIFITSITRKEKKEHVLVKIRLLTEYSRGDIMDAIKGAEEYRTLLSHYRKKVIKSMREKAKSR